LSGLAGRLLAQAHGHLGWLAAAGLAHPAILLRRRRRRAVGAAVAATALVTIGAAVGAVLYPEYRARLKPELLVRAPLVAELFERKEHLGVAAVALAWVGLAAHLLAADGGEARAGLERMAFVA